MSNWVKIKKHLINLDQVWWIDKYHADRAPPPNHILRFVCGDSYEGDCYETIGFESAEESSRMLDKIIHLLVHKGELTLL